MTIKQWAVRRLKQVVAVVGIGVVLIVTWALGSTAVANWQLRKLKNQAREDGYPVTLEELAETLPFPAEGTNAAEVYRRAFRLEVEPADRDYYEIPLVGGFEFEIAEPFPEYAAQTTKLYLGINGSYLHLLHEAANFPECRFVDLKASIDPSKGLPLGDVVVPMRHAIRHLLLESLYAGETGDTEKAADGIIDAVRLAEAAGNDPALTPCVCSGMMLDLVVTDLALMLSRRPLPEDSLQRIAEVLPGPDDLKGAEQVSLEERVLTGLLFEQLRWEDLWHPFGGSSMDFDGMIREGTWLQKLQATCLSAYYLYGGGKAWDRLAHFEVVTGILEASSLPLKERVKAAKACEEKAQALPRRRGLTRSCSSNLAGFVQFFAEHEARMCAARTGLAVECFRLSNDRLPQALEELVPQWLDAVPEDPFDGQPLRYRVEGPSYAVYSIGRDLADNGGQEYGEDGRDVVFNVEREGFPVDTVVIPPYQFGPSPSAASETP